jgi:hypothetical protein
LGTLSLKLPDSLHDTARKLAKQENISINQLITLALAEKISALMAEEYLGKRAKRGNHSKFIKAMTKTIDIEPERYDIITKNRKKENTKRANSKKAV